MRAQAEIQFPTAAEQKTKQGANRSADQRIFIVAAAAWPLPQHVGGVAGSDSMMPQIATWEALQASAREVEARHPELRPALGSTTHDLTPFQGLARLLGRILQPTWTTTDALTDIAERVFRAAEDDVSAALEDIAAINNRDIQDSGAGPAWTWLANRGFHILAAHRLVHRLWVSGERPLALAIKASMTSLAVDIHPAAQVGRRIFLDHGVGLVVGETAVIEDDVSIWHGVTLGSTLMQGGDRHPKIRRGAIIAAGSTVLGNIEVGEGAIVASNSVVLKPVPPFTTVAGSPAAIKSGYRHPYYRPRDASTTGMKDRQND